jgi:predicted esterase
MTSTIRISTPGSCATDDAEESRLRDHARHGLPRAPASPARSAARSVALVAASLLVAGACGGGGSRSAPPQAAPLPVDPLYSACTSAEPVDPGIPDEPVITLRGSRVVNHPLGSDYRDAGATARDPHDGDITRQIRVTGLADLDTRVAGDYLIRYDVTDSAKLAAAEVVRIVRVHSGRFTAQTARDIGSTGAHMGYYEHLPVHYGDDPDRKFPLIVFIHGWGGARFLDPHTVQAPLSILESSGLVDLIASGRWDDARPFIVLSPQKCVDSLTFGLTASRMKLFIDYALRTYSVDPARVYLAGHSQGSGDTWDYVNNYPRQLAAVVPISGGYGASVGCVLAETPAWAFNGSADQVVPYQDQVDTVDSINACHPAERARLAVLPGVAHNDILDPVLGLTGLGQGLPPYDVYDESIYDWLLRHTRH